MQICAEFSIAHHPFPLVTKLAKSKIAKTCAPADEGERGAVCHTICKEKCLCDHSNTLLKFSLLKSDSVLHYSDTSPDIHECLEKVALESALTPASDLSALRTAPAVENQKKRAHLFYCRNSVGGESQLLSALIPNRTHSWSQFEKLPNFSNRVRKVNDSKQLRTAKRYHKVTKKVVRNGFKITSGTEHQFHPLQ